MDKHYKEYVAILPLNKMPNSCGECRFLRCDRVGKVNIFDCTEIVRGSIEKEDLYKKRLDNCPLIEIGDKV